MHFAIWANVASSFKQIDILYRDEAGDFQPNQPNTELSVSDPLGGAVCGCRVLGAGRPGEDGPGAAAHRKNTD